MFLEIEKKVGSGNIREKGHHPPAKAVLLTGMLA